MALLPSDKVWRATQMKSQLRVASLGSVRSLFCSNGVQNLPVGRGKQASERATKLNFLTSDFATKGNSPTRSLPLFACLSLAMRATITLTTFMISECVSECRRRLPVPGQAQVRRRARPTSAGIICYLNATTATPNKTITLCFVAFVAAQMSTFVSFHLRTLPLRVTCFASCLL